jgi:hypothetical protein
VTEYVAEPHRECHSCRREYTSLAQHWAKSGCSYPPLSDGMRETVEGLLVGDASVDGRAHARVGVQSVRREHVLFCHRQLGPLSHGVTWTEPPKTDGPLYRLRTHAHPGLDRYWRWSEGTPEDVTLSRRGLGLWYACDGTIEFGGRATNPKITVRAEPSDRRATVARLLRALPISLDVRENVGRVTVVSDAVPRLLRYLGPPTPASTHKWCLDERVYRTVREDPDPVVTADMSAAERHKALLGVVADALGVGAGLTTEDFEGVLGAPRAQSVADTLGGGSWEDAKRVAGVRTTDTADSSAAEARKQALAEARKHRTATYDERACRHALQRVADRRDTDQLSTTEYDGSRRDAEPSAATVITTLSDGPRRWSDALAAVGLSAASPGSGPQYTDEDCERALTKAHADIGDPLTKSAYREWATDRPVPAPGTVAGRLGDGYWAVAVESIGGTAGKSGRTSSSKPEE